MTVGWQGHVLARLAPGRSLLGPAFRTAARSTGFDADPRGNADRLELGSMCRSARIGPLKARAAAAADPANSPGDRALAAMVADAAAWRRAATAAARAPWRHLECGRNGKN